MATARRSVLFIAVIIAHKDTTDRQPAGAIVNISSIYGAVGGNGGSIAYHASKGALRQMTKNAAIRYAPEKIRVVSVHPGFIETPMVAPFLASDEASTMTGSEVFVDGGWTAA